MQIRSFIIILIKEGILRKIILKLEKSRVFKKTSISVCYIYLKN